MKKNLALIPKITLWVLLLLGIVVSLTFYVGGSAGTLEVAGDNLNIPKFTDMFLGWNYFLLAAVICVTLVVVVMTFINKYKVDKKSAIKSLIIVCCFVAVALVCWFLGSPEKVEILGYEGTENVGTMAQLSDAMMYFTYILFVGVLVAIVWGAIYTRKK